MNVHIAAEELVQAWEEYKASATITIGQLADRREGRLYRAANERAYAILSFLEVINRGCEGNPYMANLCKSMTKEGVIYFCHRESMAPWKTVVFEIEFLPAAVSDHLDIVVSTFVAFGAKGDPTHYPPEVSTAYCRPTQQLFPVFEMSAGRSYRHAMVNEDVKDRLSGTSSTAEERRRNGNTFTRTHGSQDQYTQSSSFEDADRRYGGPFCHGSPYDERSRVDKNGWVAETRGDSRRETQYSEALDSSVTERRNREDSSKRSERDNTDRVTEIRCDVKFSAVGIDYSQTDKLFDAWRRNPVNKTASLTIAHFLRSLSDWNEALQERISQKVIDARETPGRRLRGRELDQAFLAQARQHTVVEEGHISLRRELMALDGCLQPIDPAAILSLVRRAHTSLGAGFAGAIPVLLVE